MVEIQKMAVMQLHWWLQKRKAQEEEEPTDGGVQQLCRRSRLIINLDFYAKPIFFLQVLRLSCVQGEKHTRTKHAAVVLVGRITAGRLNGKPF